MRIMKLCCAVVLLVLFGTLSNTAQGQKQPDQSGLVWGKQNGKSAPFPIPAFPQNQNKYISAFGDLDTTVVQPPQSIGWGANTDVFMSVVKLDANGNPDPNVPEVVFKGSKNANTSEWNIPGFKYWDKKTGTENAFVGFGPGNYRLTVEAKLQVITMNPPPTPPTATTRDARLIHNSLTIP